MKLMIEISLDNAAFQPQPHNEIAAILAHFASNISFAGDELRPGKSYTLRDHNGNKVGFAKVEAE